MIFEASLSYFSDLSNHIQTDVTVARLPALVDACYRCLHFLVCSFYRGWSRSCFTFQNVSSLNCFSYLWRRANILIWEYLILARFPATNWRLQIVCFKHLQYTVTVFSQKQSWNNSRGTQLLVFLNSPIKTASCSEAFSCNQIHMCCPNRHSGKCREITTLIRITQSLSRDCWYITLKGLLGSVEMLKMIQ